MVIAQARHRLAELWRDDSVRGVGPVDGAIPSGRGVEEGGGEAVGGGRFG